MAELYEFYDHVPEDKYDSAYHSYVNSEGSSKDAIASLVLHPQPAANYAAGEGPRMDIEFTWKSSANSVTESFPELVKDTGLIFKCKDSPASLVRYKCDDASPEDVMKAITALATTKDLGGGKMAFSVLDPVAATQIMENELKVLGKKPSEVGLCNLRVNEVAGVRQESYGLDEPYSYLGDCRITHPFSAVTEIREDAHVMEYPVKGTPAIGFEISTVLTVKNKAAANAMAKKLGGQTGEWNDKEQKGYFVTVKKTTAEEVMDKLGRNNFLPASIAGEVAELSRSLHPNQRYVDQVHDYKSEGLDRKLRHQQSLREKIEEAKQGKDGSHGANIRN